jgi:hypothetical protein
MPGRILHCNGTPEGNPEKYRALHPLLLDELLEVADQVVDAEATTKRKTIIFATKFIPDYFERTSQLFCQGPEKANTTCEPREQDYRRTLTARGKPRRVPFEDGEALLGAGTRQVVSASGTNDHARSSTPERIRLTKASLVPRISAQGQRKVVIGSERKSIYNKCLRRRIFEELASTTWIAKTIADYSALDQRRFDSPYLGVG